MSFSEGDIVRVKSGGPAMTIQWVDGKSAFCIWYDGNTHQEASIALSALEEAKPRSNTAGPGVAVTGGDDDGMSGLYG